MEMGIGGGMRGECMLSISEGWADGAKPMCSLSLSLSICVFLSFFNLGLVEVQEVHAGTGTAATAALTLP